MVDLMLNDDFDLKLVNGDFATGVSDVQHQQVLLILEPGSLKSDPGVGVGIGSYINDDQSPEVLKKSIQKQFEADGMTITKLQISNKNDITLKAEYK